MDAVHIHLVVNHIPVILTISGVALLLFSLFNNKREYRNVAFAAFLIAAVFTLISFASGENAEDVVENLAGVTHDVIENHEHAAATARWFMLVIGVMGVSGLTYFRDDQKKGYRFFFYTCILLGFISIGYLVYTGYLGGLIRHTELVSSLR